MDGVQSGGGCVADKELDAGHLRKRRLADATVGATVGAIVGRLHARL